MVLGSSFGQGGQCDEGGEGRVPGADDGGAPSGVAGGVGGVVDVRHPVGDMGGGGLFARGRIPVAAERVRCRERAGRVDNRVGRQSAFRAVGRPQVHRVRLVLAAGVDDPVASSSGDPGDGRAVDDPFAQRVGERLQVLAGPLRAGGIPVAARRRPAGRPQAAGPRPGRRARTSGRTAGRAPMSGRPLPRAGLVRRRPGRGRGRAGARPPPARSGRLRRQGWGERWWRWSVMAAPRSEV